MVLPQPVSFAGPIRGVAVIDMIIETAHGECGTPAVAFAGMVEDQIENGADAFCMKGCNSFAQFGHAAGHKARIECHEGDGIVAPAVGEPERWQMSLVDPGGNRHQLDGGDADALQMGDDSGMGKGRNGATLLFRHIRVQHGEGADGDLVDQAAGLEQRRLPLRALRFRHNRLGNEIGGVITEGRQAGIVAEGAVEFAGIGVDQQLGGVEPEAMIRIVGS
jgi:hypothetical protein